MLATKVFGRMGEGPNMQGLSRKHIQQGCEASLRRLGVETIDLYQVHRFDPHTPVDEMLSALDLLVRQGKVRYLGASSMAAWRFAQALSLSERNGWARFVTMQNHYNLIYREEEREMIPLCQAEGIAVIPWSPLARGLLAGTRKTPDDKTATARSASDEFAWKLYDHPADIDVMRACKEVAAAGRRARTGGHRLASVEACRHRADHRRDEDQAPGGGHRGLGRKTQRGRRGNTRIAVSTPRRARV